MISKKILLLLIFISILLTGCGGPVYNPEPQPGRGEGDIPLGRIRGGGKLKVVLQERDGTIDAATIDSSGTFYSDRLEYGETVFMLSTDDPAYEPRTYTVQAGRVQRYIMNAALPPRNRRADVQGLQVTSPSPNITLQVGTETRIRFNIQGTNTQNLSPTVWVDGGIGSLNAANVFTAVTPGEGVIRAELYGYTAELPITVVE